LTSALTDQGPYEFAVSGTRDDYIDLANTYRFVEAQIMDDDDTALDGGADVGSVNVWMHSLFSDVIVSLHQNLVSPPTNPVFKASRSRVFVPFFNKGMAALKSPPKILPSPCPL
jgi:isoleucyl-tRNA synthetase